MAKVERNKKTVSVERVNYFSYMSVLVSAGILGVGVCFIFGFSPLTLTVAMLLGCAAGVFNSRYNTTTK